ncbi:uncharacterized protein ColSpa_07044 [Colletotrichum spaethianum]|uniref:Uncharacterized protein n=1 Tax=Colletotrichum spaethianum TaxID=700344 RepID=A0AA37LHY0_9PEZI|nr:uncharacterized protein ColSpa_07044 [Colletotrichum spaethianum]GKT46863.1 hypothetical protein ColSpa_07044 [Colletotrichum spaethianum]
MQLQRDPANWPLICWSAACQIIPVRDSGAAMQRAGAKKWAQRWWAPMRSLPPWLPERSEFIGLGGWRWQWCLMRRPKHGSLVEW